MAEISDLDSLYRLLEEKAVDYKYREIANLFQKIRDKMHIENKSDLEAKAQWEINIFNFSFAGNAVAPLYTQPDNEGKLVSYPVYDAFVPQSYDYIIERLKSTHNPLLKAQYAHFLWFSPKKHGDYAQLAIDNYLQLIKLYEQKDKDDPQKHFGFDVVRVVENALLISKNINDANRIDLAKSEVKRLILDFNAESTCLFRVRMDLIGLMIKEKTVFTKADFSGIDDICFNFSQSLGDSHQAITILKLGEMVEQKAGTTKYNWNEVMAESYEKMMNACLRSNKHVAIDFCSDALEHYKLAKNSAKIQELEGVYTELSRSLEFPKIEVPINLKEYIADCEARVKELMKFTPEQIICFIMTDKSLLPGYQFTKELTQKILKKHQLQAIFPITLTDEQGHTAQCFTTPEEIELYRTLHQYHMILENYCLRYLNMVFIEGLKENKITYEALMDFFQKYSWFGKTIPKKRFNKEVPHNWLSLLAPSLFEYFTQMDYWRVSENYPNLVLCIDSLILKIEGLLRDMFFFKGIATFTSKADKKHGKRITYEKELNALLSEKRISELFDPDDLLLFKFVLIEKAGYNLRHKIAHSLMLSAEYQVHYMHLLILILLKLGSYNLTITRKTEAK
ncbi:MAG: DUF4209 domain-containing protein [Candidatus Bathyarchaeia archaeon]